MHPVTQNSTAPTRSLSMSLKDYACKTHPQAIVPSHMHIVIVSGLRCFQAYSAIRIQECNVHKEASSMVLTRNGHVQDVRLWVRECASHSSSAKRLHHNGGGCKQAMRLAAVKGVPKRPAGAQLPPVCQEVSNMPLHIIPADFTV